MRAIDTKVLVRLIVRDDAKQLRVAQKFITSGVWISHVVLVETLSVLESVYEVDRHGIAETVETALDHPDLTIQDAAAVSAALATFRKRSKVDFSDCLAIEVARKAGHLPLGTFDRNLARTEGAEAL